MVERVQVCPLSMFWGLSPEVIVMFSEGVVDRRAADSMEPSILQGFLLIFIFSWLWVSSSRFAMGRVWWLLFVLGSRFSMLRIVSAGLSIWVPGSKDHFQWFLLFIMLVFFRLLRVLMFRMSVLGGSVYHCVAFHVGPLWHSRNFCWVFYPTHLRFWCYFLKSLIVFLVAGSSCLGVDMLTYLLARGIYGLDRTWCAVSAMISIMFVSSESDFDPLRHSFLILVLNVMMFYAPCRKFRLPFLFQILWFCSGWCEINISILVLIMICFMILMVDQDYGCISISDTCLSIMLIISEGFNVDLFGYPRLILVLIPAEDYLWLIKYRFPQYSHSVFSSKYFHKLCCCLTLLSSIMSQLNLATKALDNRSPPRSLKIKVPAIDNSDLLARCSRVMLGRCLNPMCQDVESLLFMMPKLWQLKGRAHGLNLGNGRFQFEFESEQELQQILRLRASHFDGWMVSYAPWKPYAGANYPHSICFWVQITGIPFEYSTEEIFSLVGGSLGHVLAVNVEKRRIQIEFPCSKPLVFSSTLEFSDGQETQVLIDYKNLEGFCSLCYRLTHTAAHCYKAKKEVHVGREEKKFNFQGGRSRSYKKAVVGQGIHEEPEEAVSKGVKPKRSLHQAVDLMVGVDSRLSTGETSSKILQVSNVDPIEAHSVKKVRRPLFQSEEHLMEADETMPQEDVAIEIQEGTGQVQRAETFLPLINDELGAGMGAEADQSGASGLGTKAGAGAEDYEGSYNSAEHAEFEVLHRKYEELDNQVLKTQVEKPPLHPSNQSSRAGTPLRGVSIRKMNVMTALSPRQVPKEVKGKGKKSKDLGKGPIKY